MRAIDPNVLVRLITRDDGRQAQQADNFVERGAWASVPALAEATWVLGTVYGLDAAGFATAIEMLLAHEDLTLQDPDIVEAALEFVPLASGAGFFRWPDAAPGAQGGAPAAGYVRPRTGEGRGNAETVRHFSRGRSARSPYIRTTFRRGFLDFRISLAADEDSGAREV
jgi:predicted nucleic-acid-binding protein